MKRGMTTITLSLLLVSTVWLSSCNLFSNMHSDGKDSSATVLVADGLAALKRNDWANAAQYFNQAMINDPSNSEARVGYAHAALRAQGFSLGEFATSFMSALKRENSQNTTYDILVPNSWGVSTFAELDAIFTDMINALDPVVLGQTTGPYRATDPNLNLTVGIFYTLRILARVESLPGNFDLLTIPKNEDQNNLSIFTLQDMETMGLDSTVATALRALPSDSFLWFLDSANNQPPLSFIISIQSDIDTAMLRLQVAIDNSSVDGMTSEIADEFKAWQILAYQ